MSEILRDVFGNAVELIDERWQHILLHHPVMGRYRTRIAEVLRDPNVVQQRDLNPDESRYYRRYDDLRNAAYLFVAVIKEEERYFIVTAFPIRKIREGGRLIWIKR
jgi:hypothetical protein